MSTQIRVVNLGETPAALEGLRPGPAVKKARYRLLKLGPHRLEAEEILSLVLGGATGGRRDASPLAQRLLTHFGSLEALSLQDTQGLQSVQGIGPAAAACLRAAFELCFRCALVGDDDFLLKDDPFEAPALDAPASAASRRGGGADASEAVTRSGSGASEAAAGSGASASEAAAGSGAGASKAAAGSGAGASEAAAGSGAGASEAAAGSGAGASEAAAGSSASASKAAAGSGAGASKAAAGSDDASGRWRGPLSDRLLIGRVMTSGAVHFTKPGELAAGEGLEGSVKAREGRTSQNEALVGRGAGPARAREESVKMPEASVRAPESPARGPQGRAASGPAAQSVEAPLKGEGVGPEEVLETQRASLPIFIPWLERFEALGESGPAEEAILWGTHSDEQREAIVLSQGVGLQADLRPGPVLARMLSASNTGSWHILARHPGRVDLAQVKTAASRLVEAAGWLGVRLPQIVLLSGAKVYLIVHGGKVLSQVVCFL